MDEDVAPREAAPRQRGDQPPNFLFIQDYVPGTRPQSAPVSYFTVHLAIALPTQPAIDSVQTALAARDAAALKTALDPYTWDVASWALIQAISFGLGPEVRGDQPPNQQLIWDYVPGREGPAVTFELHLAIHLPPDPVEPGTVPYNVMQALEDADADSLKTLLEPYLTDDASRAIIEAVTFETSTRPSR